MDEKVEQMGLVHRDEEKSHDDKDEMVEWVGLVNRNKKRSHDEWSEKTERIGLFGKHRRVNHEFVKELMSIWMKVRRKRPWIDQKGRKSW